MTRVLETHTHADHVSGHGRLALEHGAAVCIHGAAGVDYAHETLEDGDEIEIGSVRVRTLHTPGHRPEHCCFLAGDVAVSPATRCSSATAARPDLAVEAREGAEGLFHSLHRLLELPDDVAGTAGARRRLALRRRHEPRALVDIGQERRFNAALALATVDEFIADSTSLSTPRPPNMEHIVDLNRGPFLGSAPPIEPVGENGWFVLDVRDGDAFAAGHVKGAVSVPVDGGAFGTKAGFFLPPDRPIALHADSRAQARDAEQRLHAVGFFDIAGYLVEPVAPEAYEPMELDELERAMAASSVVVIDVREKAERDSGYLPGSRHIPYRVIGEFADCLRDDKPVVTICESGARAGVAASVLAAAGVSVRPVLHGGLDAWRAQGNQVVEFRRCGT